MATERNMSDVAWRRNYALMAIVFAACQATVTTPIGFATSMLCPQIGAFGTGLVYLVAMGVSLVLAAPLCSACGPKAALIAGQSCSTMYVTLFAVAVLYPRGGSGQWIFYMVAALFGGVSSAVLLTAQGVFLNRTVAIVSELEGTSVEKVSAELAGRFASVILVLECCVKTVASLLQGKFLVWTFGGPVMNYNVMFIIFAMAAALATMTMTMISEPPAPKGALAKPGLCDKVKAAFELWPSPIIWCLGVMNILFGFCAAYLNGFVNGSFTSNDPAFGTGSLGSLAALTCVVAAVTAELFARLSKLVGKGPVMAVGSAAFLCIPLFVLIGKPDSSNNYWGEGLLALYLLQGVGRGVYEGTNKAVFSDFFPGRLSAGAFANVGLQVSIGFFSSFAMQGLFQDGITLGYMVICLATLVIPGFMAAWHFRLRAEAKSNDFFDPLLNPGRLSPTAGGVGRLCPSA